mmetsp:Transcript_42413/g.99790  ORF Transcript_42413/g.99790 Transcript_42413/m.99790 type:complete len:103 (-) Transcript_42413:235-543(-)
MAGFHRLRSLVTQLGDVVQDGIEGDIVETGTWRGGAMIVAQGVLRVTQQHESRQLWCDSFVGVPRITHPMLAVSEQDVRDNFVAYDLLDETSTSFLASSTSP